MDIFFADYYERLAALHQDLIAAIDGLTIEELDWLPGPGINSLTIVMVHSAGAERYWIGDVVGQEPSGRVRAEEFVTQGLTAVQLQQLLSASLEHARGVLAKLKLADLGELRTSPRHQRVYSVAWALLHALEHTATHLGHAQIGRQLIDQRRSDTE